MSKRSEAVNGRPEKVSAPNMPVLVSYAYLRNVDGEWREWLLDCHKHGVDLLLDSGAFSAFNAGHEIGLGEYLDFLQKHHESFFGYMQLDKLQDPVTTEKNLQIMLKQGLKPIPIHVFGDDGARMDDLFAISNLVALGGLRRPHRGPAPKSYVVQKMRWAKGRDVHWLGYTNQRMITALTPFSADCSSFTMGIRYGVVQFYLGRGTWRQVSRGEKEKTVLTPAMLDVLEAAGFEKRDFYDDRRWRRNKAQGFEAETLIPLMVNTLSWARYVRELRVKFGTRLFLASTLSDDSPVCIERCRREVFGK